MSYNCVNFRLGCTLLVAGQVIVFPESLKYGEFKSGGRTKI